jgi:hypothetical protein
MKGIDVLLNEVEYDECGCVIQTWIIVPVGETPVGRWVDLANYQHPNRPEYLD